MKKLFIYRYFTLLLPLCLLADGPTATVRPFNPHESTITWNWPRIEKRADYPAKGSDFPAGFIWGTGTSAPQVEQQASNSSYTTWRHPEEFKEPAGIGCDHENHYKEDIKIMANKLRTNAYRFSVEPGKVMPGPGQFNQAELDRYADMCVTMINHNIRPVLGFKHYSDAQWFMDLGGFEKEENIKYFVEYCVTVFKVVHPACLQAIAQRTDLSEQERNNLLPIYMTFNSPGSEAAAAYLKGRRPPCKNNEFELMATVLKNMLEAHVQVYQAIKKEDSTKTAHVGITHNVYQLDPYYWFNPLARIKKYYADLLTHTCVINFFTTGVFEISIPIKVSLKYTNPLAPHSLDIIGLNYYCHAYMPTFGDPQPSTDEIPTDNPRYTMYGEGLYRAIVDISTRLAQPLNIPIIVTENGIGTDNPQHRDLHLKRYLFALAQAIKKGHWVIGYCHWSFMDNWEWGNYKIRYGLVHVDRTIDPATGQPRLTRTVKPEAQYYIDLMKQHREHYRQHNTH